MSSLSTKYILTLIIVAVGILRLWGIRYGLPLWLVGDEPGSVFTALKMLELRSIIPSAHTDVFSGMLYYGPASAYLYLIPFASAFFIQLIASHGASAAYVADTLIADPSMFFVTARVISALLGTLTVWLVYKAARSIFEKDTPALWAAAFMGLNLFHIQFSHWARHWLVMTFVYAMVMYVVTHASWPATKRYSFSVLVTAIGAWVNINALLVGIFVLLWYFFVEKRSFIRDARAGWPFISMGTGILILWIGYMLWPPAYGFLAGFTGAVDIAPEPKSIVDFLNWMRFYAVSLLRTDPLLIVFCATGMAYAVRTKKRVVFSVAVFFALYVLILYVIFFFINRYILVLYPWFALFSGYGVYRCGVWLRRKTSPAAVNVLGTILVIALFIPPMRMDWMFAEGKDTRVQAYDWIQTHLRPETKIITDVPLFRLTSTSQAVRELADMDTQALRSADRVILKREDDPDFLKTVAYHVLNLSVLSDAKRIDLIMRELESYDYLVVASEESRWNNRIEQYIAGREPIVRFAGSMRYIRDSRNQAVPEGFGGGWPGLFQAEAFGPDIAVYKL